MIRILLCCSAGMSTSMMVNKMNQSAQGKGLKVNIEAYPVSEFDEVIHNYDVCLIAPQAKYLSDELKKKCDQLNKGCSVIDNLNYGMMQGDKVLDQALKLFQERKNT